MSVEVQKCPCVIVRCDRCDEALSWAEDGQAHYKDEQHARSAAQDADWYVEDGMFLCLSCIEDAPFYEVACPKCGAAKEESCTIDIGLFCGQRVAALAAAVKEAASA